LNKRGSWEQGWLDNENRRKNCQGKTDGESGEICEKYINEIWERRDREMVVGKLLLGPKVHRFVSLSRSEGHDRTGEGVRQKEAFSNCQQPKGGDLESEKSTEQKPGDLTPSRGRKEKGR